MGALSVAGGLFLAYRAVAWAAHHDYVLTLCSTAASVAALRAGVLFLASEVAE
jgi:hypothetical protein